MQFRFAPFPNVPDVSPTSYPTLSLTPNYQCTNCRFALRRPGTECRAPSRASGGLTSANPIATPFFPEQVSAFKSSGWVLPNHAVGSANRDATKYLSGQSAHGPHTPYRATCCCWGRSICLTGAGLALGSVGLIVSTMYTVRTVVLKELRAPSSPSLSYLERRECRYVTQRLMLCNPPISQSRS